MDKNAMAAVPVSAEMQMPPSPPPLPEAGAKVSPPVVMAPPAVRYGEDPRRSRSGSSTNVMDAQKKQQPDPRQFTAPPPPASPTPSL